VHETPDGRFAVAIALGIGVGEDLVDSGGRKLADARTQSSYSRDPESTRPLVLAVDADDVVREALRTYLTVNGYDVIAVKTGAEARQALTMLTPALLIAEVEGEGLPGFDLCAHVKSHPRLRHIPVLLTTRSGNPTDYSNAHSLGAVVCMAKPYKQDRLGHVVRLLAPPPLLKLADAKVNGRNCAGRGYGVQNGTGSANGNGSASADPSAARRFRFRPFR
jgi:CheY-like chemotaxis protein